MDNTQSWFSFRNRSPEAPVEVLIYDEIGGWGINAKDFVLALKEYEERDLTVRINSPGGSVTDGIAIYQALKRHKGDVYVVVDGLAASMASVIALAGKTVAMAENAFLMIHDPWTFTVGTADKLRHDADVLDKMEAGLAGIYAHKTGKSIEEIEALMEAETWMTAEEALDYGFIDDIEQALQVAACAKVGNFKKVPVSYARRIANVLPLEAAKSQESQKKMDELQTRIDELLAQNEALTARNTELENTNSELYTAEALEDAIQEVEARAKDIIALGREHGMLTEAIKAFEHGEDAETFRNTILATYRARAAHSPEDPGSAADYSGMTGLEKAIAARRAAAGKA